MKLVAVALLVSALAFAVDIPGGQTETAESLRADTYQLLLSPAYLISDGSAYVSGKLRYQLSPLVGVGFVFGTGHPGFQVGVDSSWNVLSAVAVHVGAHFERLGTANYFAWEVAPIASRRFHTAFGYLTPYAGLRATPSFRLGASDNDVSLKTSLGNEWMLAGPDGVQLWTEIGVALRHSYDEVVVGVSYPFTVL